MSPEERNLGKFSRPRRERPSPGVVVRSWQKPGLFRVYPPRGK